MYSYYTFTVTKAKVAIDTFLELYHEYKIKQYHLSDLEQVVLVEDSAIFHIKIDVECQSIFEQENHGKPLCDWVCYLYIEELTENQILKHNHAKFVRDFEKAHKAYGGYIDYDRFSGILPEDMPDLIDSDIRRINKTIPELRLQERLNSWEGELYHIVAYEMEFLDGTKEYALDIVKKNIHSHVLNIAQHLLEQPYDVSRIMGIGLTDTYHYMGLSFISAFQSHKNERKVKRLEEHFKYFLLESSYFRDRSTINPYLVSKYDEIKQGAYDFIERTPYIKPEYRWKSEELVLKIIKQKYKQQGVIYQHRPYFLKSSFGGQMSYDIFISGLNTAVEYQGRQHFEAVNYFGGQEAFEKLKKRDQEKQELSRTYGIKLVYINYWEDIVPELIYKKIEDMQKHEE